MPGTCWILNLAGATLTEEKMGDIPHPTMELTVHVTYKTVQAFSILGLGVAGPVAAAIKGNRNWPAIQESSMKFGRRGAVVGLVLGPLFTYLKARSCTDDGIWDRSYRLRYNRNQVRVDRVSTVGALAGAGYLAYAGGNPVNGIIVGLSAGCLLGGLYNSVIGGK